MSKSKTNNLTPKEQAKKSWEAFLKAWKNIFQTTKWAVKVVWKTAEWLYRLIDAWDLAIHNKWWKSTNKVVDFTKKNTPYPYWLARGFILLSDIYIDKQEDFQAKQYLLSLQRNYKVQDDIQEMITKRLNEIAIREKSKVSN